MQRPRPWGQGGHCRFLVRHLVAHLCRTPAPGVRGDERHHARVNGRPVERKKRRRIARRLLRPAAAGKTAAGSEPDQCGVAEAQLVRDGYAGARFRARGQILVKRRLIGIEHGIGALDQRFEQQAVIVLPQIDHDTLFVGIAGEKRNAAALRVARVRDAGIAFSRCSTLGRLDQEDIGAEIGEHQSGVLRQGVCDLDDAKPGQQAVCHSPSHSKNWRHASVA